MKSTTIEKYTYALMVTGIVISCLAAMPEKEAPKVGDFSTDSKENSIENFQEMNIENYITEAMAKLK